MRAPYTQLYVHIVWATWDRLPLVTPDIEERVYAAIAEKCRQFKCVPLAIGGMEEHVHVLAQFHTTTAIATLVKEMKGTSSHLVTHEIKKGHFFKWQGAYGAFTLRKREVPKIKSYILNQKHHHAENRLYDEYEQIFVPDKE